MKLFKIYQNIDVPKVFHLIEKLILFCHDDSRYFFHAHKPQFKLVDSFQKKILTFRFFNNSKVINL